MRFHSPRLSIDLRFQTLGLIASGCIVSGVLSLLASTLLSGCAPEGGTAKARKTQPEQQHDETKPPDPEPQRRRTTPAEFRSPQAKRIDAAFEAYRLGMAKGWRDAASQQPPAKSWDEAYARVKRNNFAEREAAFAPFAEDLDKLTEGKQFSPELFREIADTVAKALEE